MNKYAYSRILQAWKWLCRSSNKYGNISSFILREVTEYLYWISLSWLFLAQWCYNWLQMKHLGRPACENVINSYLLCNKIGPFMLIFLISLHWLLMVSHVLSRFIKKANLFPIPYYWGKRINTKLKYLTNSSVALTQSDKQQQKRQKPLAIWTLQDTS